MCGNIQKNKKHLKVAEADCDMACAGEPRRMCGGNMRTSIYLGNLLTFYIYLRYCSNRFPLHINRICVFNVYWFI